MIESLQEYPNQHVYEIAIQILENYFELEEINLNGEESAITSTVKLDFS